MSELVPPTPDPRSVRHSMQVLIRARNLREAGWGIEWIRRQLQAEFELERKPARTTILNWTEPGFRELHRTWQRKCEQPAAPPRMATPELLLALRLEDGLAYTAIAAVARRFLGEDKSPEYWRGRLYELGVPKSEKKAAHAKAQAQARRAQLSHRRAVIRERWATGATVRDIAAELGTSKSTITGEVHRMRADGIKLAERSRGRRPKAVAA